VQDVGPGGNGDVGPVVHREQRAVSGTRLGDDLQRGQFLPRLQWLPVGGLVPQLHDVHTARERGVHELREVAPVRAGVRAQIQPCVREPLPDLGSVCPWHAGHATSRRRALPWAAVVHGSPEEPG
jgi:hypothetical protein